MSYLLLAGIGVAIFVAGIFTGMRLTVWGVGEDEALVRRRR